jgi:hypothetical protein
MPYRIVLQFKMWEKSTLSRDLSLCKQMAGLSGMDVKAVLLIILESDGQYQKECLFPSFLHFPQNTNNLEVTQSTVATTTRSLGCPYVYFN